MIDKIELLTEILLDPNARIDERDDAAMDLGEEFTDDSVLEVLIQVACNPNEVEIILNSCGEAIGKIWVKRKMFNKKIYSSLTGTSRYGVYIIIKSQQPEWVKEYELEKTADFSD